MVLMICAATEVCRAQSTIGYGAGIGQRDVYFQGAPLPDGNQVQIGFFDSGFDVSGNAGNIFTLASAWNQLAFTDITTIFNQPGRFGANASTADPAFDGQKVCLWLFKTSDDGAPLPNFSNVTGFGIFSSTSANWIFPIHNALPPGNTTSVNSSEVDQVFNGSYDFNHLILSPVPEPGTCVLLGISGVIILFGLKRRGLR